MSVVTLTFYDGETGDGAAAPHDFELFVYPPGSNEQQAVKIVGDPDQKLVAIVESGVYTVHFSSEAKIVSLYEDEPCDVTMLILEGDDARANFEVYLWDVKPDEDTKLPENLMATCAYCVNRYTTPDSPYYQNWTWYNNCRTNPICT